MTSKNLYHLFFGKDMYTGTFQANLNLAVAVKIFWMSASGIKCKVEIIWSLSAKVYKVLLLALSPHHSHIFFSISKSLSLFSCPVLLASGCCVA